MKISLSASSLVLSLSLALPAVAGVHVLTVHESLAEKKDPMNINVWVEKDRVRIDGMGPGYMIYRGDKQLMWMVNEQDKSYTEVTKQDVEQISAKMDDAMKKLNEQMAKMPPEQREMMEKAMKSIKGGQASVGTAKTTYKKTGSDKVNSWSCDTYEGDQEGKKKSELCVASMKKVGDISEGDVQALKDMAGFFGKMSKGVEQFMPSGNADNGLPKGVLPVRTVTYRDGQPDFKTEVKEIKKENVAASHFDLPTGLTKKNFGGGPRGESGF